MLNLIYYFSINKFAIDVFICRKQVLKIYQFQSITCCHWKTLYRHRYCYSTFKLKLSIPLGTTLVRLAVWNHSVCERRRRNEKRGDKENKSGKVRKIKELFQLLIALFCWQFDQTESWTRISIGHNVCHTCPNPVFICIFINCIFLAAPDLCWLWEWSGWWVMLGWWLANSLC